MSELISSDIQQFDGAKIVDYLNRLLRLRTTVIGMKLFVATAEMEAMPRIRRPMISTPRSNCVAGCAQWLDGGYYRR